MNAWADESVAPPSAAVRKVGSKMVRSCLTILLPTFRTAAEGGATDSSAHAFNCQPLLLSHYSEAAAGRHASSHDAVTAGCCAASACPCKFSSTRGYAWRTYSAAYQQCYAVIRVARSEAAGSPCCTTACTTAVPQGELTSTARHVGSRITG